MSSLSRRNLVKNGASGLILANAASHITACKFGSPSSSVKEVSGEQQQQILAASSEYGATPLTADGAARIVDKEFKAIKSGASPGPLLGTTDVSKMDFWDAYLQAYSYVVKTAPYQAIASDAASRFSSVQNCVIADLGCGLGEISSVILSKNATAKIYLVDPSSFAQAAWKKSFANQPGIVPARQSDMRSFDYSIDRFTGVILNNALFVLPDADQQSVLNNAFAALTAPGSILYLNEPNNAMSTLEGIGTFLSSIGADFARQEKPMSEFSFAMLVNTNFITFVPQLQVRTSAVTAPAGFQVAASNSSFYNGSQTTVFTRTGAAADNSQVQ